MPPAHPQLTRVSSRGYDLQERRRTGNMTGAEQAKYRAIPTDETEAQTLASADLDGIKSECKNVGVSYVRDLTREQRPCPTTVITLAVPASSRGLWTQAQTRVVANSWTVELNSRIKGTV